VNEQTTDEFMKDLTDEERRLLRLLRYVVKDEREKTRSFWRAVFDAWWSGETQKHAAIQKLFKE